METDPVKSTSVVHGEDIDYHLAHPVNMEDHGNSIRRAINTLPWAFACCLFAVWAILLGSFENQESVVVVSIPQIRERLRA
ncbi:hypothetical protein BDW71DRAFT_170476 [Aspergillus fruticulosus]